MVGGDPRTGGEGVTAKTPLSREAVLAALEDVKDPEIPVVSVVELGIVQAVEIEGDRVRVAITPTFSGCPALELMRAEIAERLRALGAAVVEVPIRLDPPWTSDRISPAARERMRAIGLAPPPPRRAPAAPDPELALAPFLAPSGYPGAAELDPVAPVACPFCASEDTVLENAFGPTICRALYYCRACRQPFERFKAL